MLSTAVVASLNGLQSLLLEKRIGEMKYAASSPGIHSVLLWCCRGFGERISTAPVCGAVRDSHKSTAIPELAITDDYLYTAPCSYDEELIATSL